MCSGRVDSHRRALTEFALFFTISSIRVLWIPVYSYWWIQVRLMDNSLKYCMCQRKGRISWKSVKFCLVEKNFVGKLRFRLPIDKAYSEWRSKVACNLSYFHYSRSAVYKPFQRHYKTIKYFIIFRWIEWFKKNQQSMLKPDKNSQESDSWSWRGCMTDCSLSSL